jgi:small basic protein
MGNLLFFISTPDAFSLCLQFAIIAVLDAVSTAVHGGGAAVKVANQPRRFLRRLN